MVNKALLWGRQNHNTLKAAQNFLIVGLLRSKWHLRIHTQSVSYITQTILWKSDEVCNWYKFVGINWSLGWVLGNYFFDFHLELWFKMGNSGTNPALWIVSIVHDRMWNNPVKIIQCSSEIKENSFSSLPHILKCNQSRTLNNHNFSNHLICMYMRWLLKSQNEFKGLATLSATF